MLPPLCFLITHITGIYLQCKYLLIAYIFSEEHTNVKNHVSPIK